MHRFVVPLTVLVMVVLAPLGTALAAKAPKPEKYATTTTLTVGSAMSPQGVAPEIRGELSSKNAACLKSRTVSGTFTSTAGTEVTIPASKTLTDGSWAVTLPAEDQNDGSGTVEVTVKAKSLGAKGSCGSATKKLTAGL